MERIYEFSNIFEWYEEKYVKLRWARYLILLYLEIYTYNAIIFA